MVVALNHMRVPEDRDMASKNNTQVVDMIFGGHDHCYLSELNQETGVLLVKSGTDFEVFTNLTVLFDIEPDQFNHFSDKVKDDKSLSVFYHEETKRMYVSEQVVITERFEQKKDVEDHVQKFA